MLTVEEYISKMKKKDRLDEFSFRNHAENMQKVISYVMEYFNSYLDPEAYDYENIKIDQTIAKIKIEIVNSYPKSESFIADYYKKYKSRIDKIFKKWLEDLKYSELFYCQEDYENAVSKFCDSYKMKGTGIEQYKTELIILAEEIIKSRVEKPSISDFKHIDESIIAWVKETYCEYGVNLFNFVQDYTWRYHEEYIEYVYCRQAEESYRINRYNHRYNNNPFAIDDVYKENYHRPFINGRKGELEMLIMYDWLFNDVNDSEYWPEYVNLCISTGRVSKVNNVNILLPVINKCIQYPPDIQSSLVFAETTNGSIGINPGTAYILRLNYNKDADIIWKDQNELKSVIKNLNDTFSKYGAPYVLEIFSPLRSNSYNEEEFFEQYRVLEKGLRKYNNMKIAIVNGPSRHKSKPNYLVQTIDNIIKIRNIAKEMKFKLKLVIDISKLIDRKNWRSEIEGTFNQLSEIRKTIIGIHLYTIYNSFSIPDRLYDKDDKVFLNKFDYHKNSDFLSCLSALCNDNQCRYMVPDGINDPDLLEELVDNLLRGGFSFHRTEEE